MNFTMMTLTREFVSFMTTAAATSVSSEAVGGGKTTTTPLTIVDVNRAGVATLSSSTTAAAAAATAPAKHKYADDGNGNGSGNSNGNAKEEEEEEKSVFSLFCVDVNIDQLRSIRLGAPPVAWDARYVVCACVCVVCVYV